MTKSRRLFTLVLLGLAAVGGGCASHPTRNGQRHNTVSAATHSSDMTRYGVSRQVLQAASDLGYSPRTRNGRILFCQNEARLGSIIPHYRCVDAASLTVEFQRLGSVRRRLERSNNGCYAAPPACQ